MKRVLKRGDFKLLDDHSGFLWIDDPNGRFTMMRLEYTWYERLLTRFGFMKDKRYSGKYTIISDPINP